jgi:thioredoxin 1
MKLLKFYATWCGPCKGLTSVIEGMKDLPVPIQNVDIDAEMDTARKYNVRSVPTMVLVNDDGSEVKRVVGMMNEKQIIEFMGA